MRPKYDCTLEKSQDDCLKAIKENNADLTVVSGGSVLRATKEYNTVPIIAESYGPGSTNFNERPAVAVVSKSSSINKLGKKWHSLIQLFLFSEYTFSPVHPLILRFRGSEEQEVLSQRIQG